MKTIKALFLVSIVLLVTSCKEDTDMNKYPARSNEAFFLTEAHSYSVASEDDETTYTIAVTRANSSGKASVKVLWQSEKEETFTLPEAVEFADGALQAPLAVSFDLAKFTRGETAKLLISLESATELAYSTVCQLSVSYDYTWQTYATGTFKSGFISDLFEGDMSWEQSIERAAENPNMWRLHNCYLCDDTEDYVEPGYGLRFSWDGTSREIVMESPADSYGYVTVDSGFVHPSVGMISLYIDPNPNYSGYDADSKSLTFSCMPIYGGGYALFENWVDEVFTFASDDSGSEGGVGSEGSEGSEGGAGSEGTPEA